MGRKIFKISQPERAKLTSSRGHDLRIKITDRPLRPLRFLPPRVISDAKKKMR